jgi:hypothetical protein
MRVILSRKGFDSKFGGGPSPILPDGRMLSFPIPSSDELKWDFIQWNKEKTYWDLMTELGLAKKHKKKNCHLDPDIAKSAKNRLSGWRGAFGQLGAAQTHLASQGVEPGDLFLFFGWFRQTELHNGIIRYVRGAPDIHAIFGFLQIESILTNQDLRNPPGWLVDHPHCLARRLAAKDNRIYLASEKFSADKSLPGYGTFQFNDDVRLTKTGLSRSKWGLDPSIFSKVQISYHSKNNWKDGYFDSAKIGQEFVIQTNSKVSDWATDLIRKSLV